MANDGLPGFGAVEVERFLRFAREVHQLRGARLHAVRHFVGGNPRGDFAVARVGQAQAIEIVDRSDELPLSAGAIPSGLARFRIGAPVLRNGTP